MPEHRTLRILVIAPTPFFADRGCHVRILEEIRQLRMLGHDVLVCTYHHGRDVPEIAIKRSLKIPWYSKLSAGPSVHKLYIDVLLLLSVIWAGFRFKPDILHAHLHEGIVIGKIASLIIKVPMVADLQGSLSGELVQHQFIKGHNWVFRLIRKVEAAVMQWPNGLLLSSPTPLPGLQDVRGMSSVPVMEVPDGVDTALFQPKDENDREKERLRESLGIPQDHKIIGYLGVLTEYQGISVLLHAMVAVRQRVSLVTLLLMGYPNVEYYQAKAQELGIAQSVVFTGRVPYEMAPAYLSLCHVLVSPKWGSTEANGKLLNYMAMGKPVVAADTAVNRSILGEDGTYVEPGDARALADAIVAYLTDDGRARAHGAYLRKRVVEEFAWNRLVRRIETVYQSVLDRSHATQRSMKTTEHEL